MQGFSGSLGCEEDQQLAGLLPRAALGGAGRVGGTQRAQYALGFRV